MDDEDGNDGENDIAGNAKRFMFSISSLPELYRSDDWLEDLGEAPPAGAPNGFRAAAIDVHLMFGGLEPLSICATGKRWSTSSGQQEAKRGQIQRSGLLLRHSFPQWQ